MPSYKQLKGLTLEEATYQTFLKILQLQMRTPGKEESTNFGKVWVGHGTIYLFWNSQVPKSSYTDDEGERIITYRQPDLVLCHKIWTESDWEGIPPSWTNVPIMAVELKNYNLGYRWNKAWVFDRDVMRRFLRVKATDVPKLLSVENWEANFRNSFPNAIKILIQPTFGFTAKAERIPHTHKTMAPDVAHELEEKRKLGLIPASTSENDKILWRIKRLGLRVYQLGYDLKPGEQLPKNIETKLRKTLSAWLKESLKRNFHSTKLPQQTPLPTYYSRDHPIMRGATGRRNIWNRLTNEKHVLGQ